MVDSSPIVAIKSLKVSDFQGTSSNLCSIFFLENSELLKVCRDNCVAEICVVSVSLSTIGRSTLEINPDLPEAKNLMSW
jgi:replication factor A1